MPERVVGIASDVAALTKEKLGKVADVATATKMLAINAAIEAAHAGSDGAGFAVVAKEVGTVADEVRDLSEQLNEQLAPMVADLMQLGDLLVWQVRGTRLADLALHVIDLIDRNLYERSCDVRWWATDSAVVDACTEPTPEACAYASHRLGVILSSYTVYLDLAIADVNGKVIAHGRPGRYRLGAGTDVSTQGWFVEAMKTRRGSEFAVVDVYQSRTLEGATVAVYSTAVRAGARDDGEIIGALGIFFDWAPQAHAIVTGVDLTDEERARTRVMLVDHDHLVLAASDGQGILTERIDLSQAESPTSGVFRRTDGTMVGYRLTPGYETYRGLGWYGVITQAPPDLSQY